MIKSIILTVSFFMITTIAVVNAAVQSSGAPKPSTSSVAVCSPEPTAAARECSDSKCKVKVTNATCRRGRCDYLAADAEVTCKCPTGCRCPKGLAAPKTRCTSNSDCDGEEELRCQTD